jgi:hypothetical protein
MSTNLVRMKFAAVAAKIETVPGTDAIGGTPAAADWIASEMEVQFDPTIIELPELTGSLDKASSVVGGLKPRLRLRMPLRGSGTAGTAPDFGKLMRCSTFAELVTAAAIGAPTAATAGTTTTVTAATPFGTTAQQYRGMPLIVTGIAAGTTGIVDYTAARVITTGDTAGTAYTIGSLLQIPINVLYSPTSDESVYKTATIYFYADGLLWTFTGALGTPSLELTTGGIGFVSFEMRAQFASKSATAVPAGAAAVLRPTPPRFVGGKCQLNKALAQVRTLTINAGVNVILPDDPESAEGYGAALPIERDVAGNLDPYMNTTNSVALFNAFRAGTPMSLMAIIGSTAGNRFVAIVPNAKAIGMDPGARDGLGQHGVSFQADGADSAFYLAQF